MNGPAGGSGPLSRLVERDEFMSRDQAIEELLSKGISVYDTTDESPTELDEEVFTSFEEDQRDPALDTE